ncbi:DEAD/DEAH box helicase [Blastopirellula marina]|uniref:Helicase SNF2 n=1 Tax=Blastopirellula marina TaxID=124 RepID=A0A2S8GLL8_9BACT|nr:DEAD/DEAH box helicase [Blastopirellula marina]PQO45310.1 helicase SNF2 [Blastopirellula marina]
MPLADLVKSHFVSKIRERGMQYVNAGSVELMEHQSTWATLEVEGSAEECYNVHLEWSRRNDVHMECDCPHFGRGNNCKHLWAAIVYLDRNMVKLGLKFPEGPGRPHNAPRQQTKPASSPPPKEEAPPPVPAKQAQPWRSLLSRFPVQVARKAHPSTNTPSESSARVCFRLNLYVGGSAPLIELYQQEPSEEDSWGPLEPLQLDDRRVPQITNPDDRRLLLDLLGHQVLEDNSAPGFIGDYFDSPRGTEILLNPELFETILPQLSATGRFLFWREEKPEYSEPRPILWNDGPPWKFRLCASRDEANRQWKLTGELYQGRKKRPLEDGLRFYGSGIMLFDGELCRFDPPADMRWLQLCLDEEAVTVPFDDRKKLIEELWQTGRAVTVTGDKALNVRGSVGDVKGKVVIHSPDRRYYYGASTTLYASVSFRYGKKEVPLLSKQYAWFDAESSRVMTYNDQAEQALLTQLMQVGMQEKAVSPYGYQDPGHLQFPASFLNDVVDTLVDQDWEVHADGARVRKANSLAMSVRSGVDWFDLEGSVDFDGQTVPLPELLAAVRRNEKSILLGDGSRGILPHKWLEQYQSLAGFAEKGDGDSLRFQSSQALLLDAMLSTSEANQSLQVDRRFAAQRKKLKTFAGIKPAKPSKRFQGSLREYQQEGLGWMLFLEKFGLGGCLADDMGLGKTVQVLALLADRQRRRGKKESARPALIVVPNSILHNWRQEAERFAPNLNVAEYTGTRRKKELPDLEQFDLVLTTYGTMRKDIERLSNIPWDYVILDEAQAIKNASSQTAKASRLLNARHRLALSGTPIENHLGELWSLFDFLNPGLLGSSTAFKSLTRDGSQNDPQNIEALREGIAPFLLRRTKAEVLPQLPKKMEQRLYCELPAAQQKQYDQMREHYRQGLAQKIAETGLAKAKIHVLEALLRLRQTACHPGLVDPQQKSKSSAKLDLLMEQLEEVVGEGHKALIFSQFTTMLHIVQERLDKAGIRHEYLDGKTKDRQGCVERFQNDPACSVFLISLKAGGTGLNLTAADYVYLLDPWWNPAVEAQAIDRAHRMGQTKSVFAYRLIARNTVEEKILELQSQKNALADALISADSSLLKSLTAEDLQAILS